MSFCRRSSAECRNGWSFLGQYSLDSRCSSSIVENCSILRQLRLLMSTWADSVLPAVNLGARTLNKSVGRENWPRTRVGPLSAAWLTMFSSAWFSLTLKAYQLGKDVDFDSAFEQDQTCSCTVISDFHWSFGNLYTSSQESLFPNRRNTIDDPDEDVQSIKDSDIPNQATTMNSSLRPVWDIRQIGRLLSS